MSSAPREVKEREGAEYAHLKRARRAGRLQDADDRRRYEEANFTRLAVSKKNRVGLFCLGEGRSRGMVLFLVFLSLEAFMCISGHNSRNRPG